MIRTNLNGRGANNFLLQAFLLQLSPKYCKIKNIRQDITSFNLSVSGENPALSVSPSKQHTTTSDLQTKKKEKQI
jgi:hypothetical protein